LSHEDLLLCCRNHLVGLLLLLVVVVRLFTSHGCSIEGGVNTDLDRGVVVDDGTDAMLGSRLRNSIRSCCPNA
jgi:hypothetical protein